MAIFSKWGACSEAENKQRPYWRPALVFQQPPFFSSSNPLVCRLSQDGLMGHQSREVGPWDLGPPGHPAAKAMLC